MVLFGYYFWILFIVSDLLLAVYWNKLTLPALVIGEILILLALIRLPGSWQNGIFRPIIENSAPISFFALLVPIIIFAAAKLFSVCSWTLS